VFVRREWSGDAKAGTEEDGFVLLVFRGIGFVWCLY